MMIKPTFQILPASPRENNVNNEENKSAYGNTEQKSFLKPIPLQSP